MLRCLGVRPRTTIEAYIHEQPAFLRRVFAEIPALVATVWPALPPRPAAVVLINSGTSGHALMAVHALVARRLACPVFVCGPLAFISEAPIGTGAGTMAVVLSQSGASRTTTDVARTCR
jgi:fructoselysine-6-P-deglycase FrlB-like protein